MGVIDTDTWSLITHVVANQFFKATVDINQYDVIQI